MKQDSLFWAICNLEDDLILEAEEGTTMEKKHGKKAVRIALIAAAAAARRVSTRCKVFIGRHRGGGKALYQVGRPNGEKLESGGTVAHDHRAEGLY